MSEKKLDYEKARTLALNTICEWCPGFDKARADGQERWFPSPLREDRSEGSFSINIETGQFSDFAAPDDKGDTLTLYARIKGIKNGDAAKELLSSYTPEPFNLDAIKQSMMSRAAGAPRKFWSVDTKKMIDVHQRWFYSDGVCSFWIVRHNYPKQPGETKAKKEIMPMKWNSFDEKWIDGKPEMPAKGYPLYNLDRILEDPDAHIILVEGEKAADAIPAPFIGTTFANGSRSIDKTDFSPLKGRTVTIWGDNDDAGKECAERLQKKLCAHAKNLSIIEPPTDWPEKADAADFDEDARRQAISGAKQIARAKSPFPIHSFDEIEIHPPVWLIKGILEADSFSCLFGASGSGKSYAVLSIACCIASKKPFFGHEIKKTGPVIYIAGEGFSGIVKRIRAWEKYHETPLPKKSIFVSGCAAALGDDGFMEHVSDSVGEVAGQHGSPVLIIIDTWARNMTGNENDTADTSAAIRSLDALRKTYNCSTIVVHHTGKADFERARGSSALRAALDTEYQVDNTKDILTIKNTKMKDGEIPESMIFAFQYVDLGITDEDGEPVFSSVITEAAEGIMSMKSPQETKSNEAAAIRILEANPEGIALREFHAEMRTLGMSQKTVKRVKDELIASGKAEIDGLIIKIISINKTESPTKPWEKPQGMQGLDTKEDTKANTTEVENDIY